MLECSKTVCFLSSPEAPWDAPLLSGGGVRPKPQELGVLLLGGKVGHSSLNPPSTQLVTTITVETSPAGKLWPSLLVLRMLTAVLSVATFPCPVPVAVLLDGKKLMRRGTFSCAVSVPFKMCILTLGQEMYAL